MITVYAVQHPEMIALTTAADDALAARYDAWIAASDIEEHTDAEYELFAFVHARLEQAGVDRPERVRLAGVRRLMWTEHQPHLAAWKKTTGLVTQSGVAVLEPAELAIRRLLPERLGSTLPGRPLPVVVGNDSYDAAVEAVRAASSDPKMIVAIDPTWGSPTAQADAWKASTVHDSVHQLERHHAALAAALWRGVGDDSIAYIAYCQALLPSRWQAAAVLSPRALSELDQRMRPRLQDLPVDWVTAPQVRLWRSKRAARKFITKPAQASYSRHLDGPYRQASERRR